MFADELAQAFIKLLFKLPKIIKSVFKAVMFFGLYWFAVFYLPDIAFQMATHNTLSHSHIRDIFDEIFMAIACVFAILTTIQSVIRMIKKDNSFRIFHAILQIPVRQQKGFESSVGKKGIFREKAAEFLHKQQKSDFEVLKKAEGLSGVVFGKINGEYVTQPENIDGHVLIIGGTRSGKTSGIVIPTIKVWNSRVIAIDIKGELYEKTHEARNDAQIKVFDPTDPTACGYDPFYLMRSADDISDAAKDLSLAICPVLPNDKDPYFAQQAQSLLTGLLIYFFHQGLNFSETSKLILSQPVKQTIADIMISNDEKAKLEVSTYDGDFAEKTLGLIFSCISDNIKVFATNDDLQRALSGDGDTITPNDLENGYDIYCRIPEHKLEKWKSLFGMMCNQFFKAFERRPEDNKTPILFVLDEFPRLGKIEAITNGLSTLQSKGVRIALVIQSKAQLNAIYGKDYSEVITDNCSYKAILRASEPNTQEWCSKLVGTYDKQKRTSNYNADMAGIGKGHGISNTTEEKRIIKPEEFAYLNDVVCLFPDGFKRLDKIKYWEDKAFQN